MTPACPRPGGCSRFMPRNATFLAGLALGAMLAAVPLAADPLTQSLDLDFGRDVASRDLKGLATRSDGCIVAGPVLTELSGPSLGELLWTLAPAGADRWLLGTGPDGRIEEVTVQGDRYTVREVARLSEPQVFALRLLPGGAILAGTSSPGGLYLVKDGKPTARVVLTVDSIFDIALLAANGEAAPAADAAAGWQGRIALVATGNPGRIYRVDLGQFAAAGINPQKITEAAALAAKGITLVGEIRDRNVRRLAVLPDGDVVAGSSPRGNIYRFHPAASLATAAPAQPVPPIILEENRDAEVTDLLAEPDGGLYASVVFSSASGENRIRRLGLAPVLATLGESPAETPGPAPIPTPATVAATLESSLPEPANLTPARFSGRSKVVYFPAGGYPETLLSRSGLAFYQLARRGDLLLIAGGEQGEMLGWDLKQHVSLTFPGSVGSQVNALAMVPGDAGRFLLLHNNAPGLARLDFAGPGPRELETKRLDLGVPGDLGNLRFDSLRNLTPNDLQVEARVSFGADETEGWTAWTRLGVRDGAYYAPGLRGRYVRLRLTVPSAARDFLIDTATLYSLPEDRRPVLTDFRLLPPNYALIPAPEPRPPPFLTLGQMVNPNQPAAGAEGAALKLKNTFMASQLVPSPGAQVAYWTVSDADGDTLAYTFSIRRAGTTAWTDLAVRVPDNFVQFDTSALPDGLYRTRLVAAEQAPRPTAQRLRAEFETDDLLVDHTPPEILAATVHRDGTDLVVTVHGRDALSLLDGVEFSFNNGDHELVQHPVDGILDGREETFELRTPVQNVVGATSVEIHLADQSGNTASRRLPLP